MLNFKKIFTKKCSIIGMIHLQPLPGTPDYKGSINKIVKNALEDAEIFLENKIDGLLIENMNDLPYLKQDKIGPETTATMAKVCSEIRHLAKDVPCGVQVLAGANKQALAIAKACSLDFIRAEGFVFGHIADEGYIDACAGELLRYKKYIDAQNVLIFTDIKKKHSSHAITSDVDLIECAKAAEFFKSDGVIITGKETGDPVHEEDLVKLKLNSSLPILIGSGVTKDNFNRYLYADALIIGSYFKENGKWNSDVCSNRVKTFMSSIKNIDIPLRTYN